MLELIQRFIREEEGQGIAEYGLIITLVAAVVITALTVMGETILLLYQDFIAELGNTF